MKATRTASCSHLSTNSQPLLRRVHQHDEQKIQSSSRPNPTTNPHNQSRRLSSPNPLMSTINPYFGLKFDYSTDSVENGNSFLHSMIGNFLLQIAAHDKITSIILAIEYSMLIIHSYYESGWFGFLVMASTCLVGIISTRKYVSFSLFHQPDFQVSTTEERNRILTSMVLFSIRFFMQQQNRILLMPMYILIMITTNTLCKQLFWALLPIYYVSLHFVASCIYNVIQFGLNSETIPLCFDYIAIAMAIVLLSNYMIKTSMNLQSKVKTLEETRLKLENALAAKQTFLRHISHEFRSPCLSRYVCSSRVVKN